MDKILDWSSQFVRVALDAAAKIVEFLPQATGVALILFLGWIVARIGKIVIVRLIQGLNRISPRMQIAGTPILPKIDESFALVISKVFFWVIILVFGALSSDLLGLGVFADWLGNLVSYLPNVLSGVLIIWAGVVFGGLVGQAISTTAVNLSDTQRVALSRVAQVFVLILLTLIGVDQIGVDITIVVTILSVTIAAGLGGLAVAFALGARRLVSNLIGIRYLNPDYQLGQRIRIGEHEGMILEKSSVAVTLDTDQGRVTIPAHLFSDQPSILVTGESKDV